MAMNTVRIAELKNRLSEYLRMVRSGRSLTVLDRDTPIARILPYEDRSASLTVRSPVPGTRKLKDVKLPPPLPLHVDIVRLLLEERQASQ
jgi:prevent-host-death family protein